MQRGRRQENEGRDPRALQRNHFRPALPFQSGHHALQRVFPPLALLHHLSSNGHRRRWLLNMDADISDILASVSAPPINDRTLDLQALTRAWVNERTAPELLPYPTHLIERVAGRVKQQVRYDRTSRESRGGGGKLMEKSSRLKSSKT